MREGTQASQRAPRRLPGGCAIILLAALAPALFIAFIGLQITGHDPRLLWYQYQTVDSVNVTRIHLEGFTAPAPFDRTVTDAGAAQTLYNAAFALSPFPPGYVVSCPLAPTGDFRLDFLRQGSQVFTVDVVVGACSSVSLGGLSERRLTPEFTTLLAFTLGVTELPLEQPAYSTAPGPPMTPTVPAG